VTKRSFFSPDANVDADGRRQATLMKIAADETPDGRIAQLSCFHQSTFMVNMNA